MTSPDSAPRVVKYRGVDLRSMLEARWASFLDVLGWPPFVYEATHLGSGYLPDLLYEYGNPGALVVEVKAANDEEQFRSNVPHIERGLRRFVGAVLITGPVPIAKLDWPRTPGRFELNPNAPEPLPAGWFTPARDDGRVRAITAPTRRWAAGVWAQCRDCDMFTVTTRADEYLCYPCGHELGREVLTTYDSGRIHDLWNEANNPIRWNPPGS